ncbi:hypothetical protein ACFGVR_06120 [Mucilaginibacter sp. AW1-3]
MKKIFLLTAFCAMVVQLKAQNAVLFKIKYLPNHTYLATTKMGMNIEMDYDADSVTLKQIKASGAKLPMLMSVQTDMRSDLKTRNYNLNKEVPFTMVIAQSKPVLTINGSLAPVPDEASSQTVYGRYSPGGKVTVEGVQDKKLTDSVKSGVMGLIDNIQANVEFPKFPIKVGDSFAQETDMAVPIPGFDARMTMKITYKLISVTNGKAHFNMDFVTTIDKKSGATGMKMEGTGKGGFIFNIGTNYAESMNETINMTYVRPMPQQKVSMKGTVQMVMEQQVTIK